MAGFGLVAPGTQPTLAFDNWDKTQTATTVPVPVPAVPPVTGDSLNVFSGLRYPTNTTSGYSPNILGIGTAGSNEFGLKMNPATNYGWAGNNNWMNNNNTGSNDTFYAGGWTPENRATWLNQLGNQTMIQGIGTIGGLALNTLGAFNALQGLKLSKKAFNFNKGLVLNNMENNVRSFNSNLYNYYQAKATAERGDANAYNDRARAGYLRHVDGSTPGVPA